MRYLHRTTDCIYFAQHFDQSTPPPSPKSTIQIWKLPKTIFQNFQTKCVIALCEMFAGKKHKPHQKLNTALSWPQTYNWIKTEYTRCPALNHTNTHSAASHITKHRKWNNNSIAFNLIMILRFLREWLDRWTWDAMISNWDGILRCFKIHLRLDGLHHQWMVIMIFTTRLRYGIKDGPRPKWMSDQRILINALIIDFCSGFRTSGFANLGFRWFLVRVLQPCNI